MNDWEVFLRYSFLKNVEKSKTLKSKKKETELKSKKNYTLFRILEKQLCFLNNLNFHLNFNANIFKYTEQNNKFNNYIFIYNFSR